MAASKYALNSLSPATHCCNSEGPIITKRSIMMCVCVWERERAESREQRIEQRYVAEKTLSNDQTFFIFSYHNRSWIARNNLERPLVWFQFLWISFHGIKAATRKNIEALRSILLKARKCLDQKNSTQSEIRAINCTCHLNLIKSHWWEELTLVFLADFKKSSFPSSSLSLAKSFLNEIEALPSSLSPKWRTPSNLSCCWKSWGVKNGVNGASVYTSRGTEMEFYLGGGKEGSNLGFHLHIVRKMKNKGSGAMRVLGQLWKKLKKGGESKSLHAGWQL